MRRFYLLLLLLTLATAGPARAQLIPFHGPVPVTSFNTMTLTDKTGSGLTNYPLRIGRAFIAGAVTNYPQLIFDGTPVATQANVTNRYADGSVKFAVLSAVVPSVAVNGTVAISFQNQATANNTAISTGTMTGMLPSDATMRIDAPAELAGAPGSPYTVAQWAAINNGSFCITIDGSVRCPVIDFTGVADNPSIAAKIQAALVALGSSVTVWGSDGYHWTLQTNAVGAGHSISTATAPAGGTDIRGPLGWGAPQFQQPSGTATASLKTMLNGGLCLVRDSGPIAQTISCADDTIAASQDIGFDGHHHPLRPRFYATFWPALSKIDLRFVGDGSKSTEIMDQLYKATLSISGSEVYSLDLTGTVAPIYKKHWANASWVKRLWQGTAPPLQVDIDPNLVYMTSTRFIPNFDPSVPMQRSSIDTFYHSIADGSLEPWDGGYYTPQMSSTGGRIEIGPYPVNCIDWLYTGMWQMRDLSERMADMANGWPLDIRETQTGRRLSRSDTAGTSTGLGHVISITDRPYIASATPYLMMFRPSYGSDLTVIGPVDFNPPWAYDDSHLPAPHYIPYLLTGDPYYLDKMYSWAGFVAFTSDGQAGYYYAGRGPTGREGVINSQPRGLGWDIRSRTEVAFIAPDADPEKVYFTYLANDALARWEGAINITGTPYQTAPVIVGSRAGSSATCPSDCNLWTWGHIVGNHNAPSAPQSISPLHSWELYCDPTTTDPSSPCDAAGYIGADTGALASDVGALNSPWMQNYFLYGIVRASELGFAAGPMESWLEAFNVGTVLDAGPSLTNPSIPGAELAGMYRTPVALHSTGTWIQSWPDVLNHLWPAYRDGTPASTAYPGGLPDYYANSTGWNPRTGAIGIPPGFNSGCSQCYASIFVGVTCQAAAADTRGPDACAWFHAGHAPTPYANGPGGNDPRWSLITRTDTNVLPSISTAVP